MPAEQADVVAGRGDAATGLSGAHTRHIQRSADAHSAALHVAHQHDAAVFPGDQRLRLDHAGVVNRALQQAAGRLSGQQHLAAIGLDQAAVLDQRVHRAFVDCDVEQAVAGNVERDRVAGRQRHRAEFG